MRKFRERKQIRTFFGEKLKNAKILRKKVKYGREIMNYDIIKFLMLTSLCREFHTFFCAINCYSYGFRGICFREISRKQFREKYFCEILHRICIFFTSFILLKIVKFREKVCNLRTKIFVFFAKLLVRWKPALN